MFNMFVSDQSYRNYDFSYFAENSDITDLIKQVWTVHISQRPQFNQIKPRLNGYVILLSMHSISILTRCREHSQVIYIEIFHISTIHPVM